MSLQTVVCHQRCIAGPVTQTHEQCHSFVCHSLCRPLLHSTLSRITAEFCSVLLSVSVSLFTCLFDVVFLVVCYQESLLSSAVSFSLSLFRYSLSVWHCVSCCLLSRITAEVCSVLFSVSVSLFTVCLTLCFLLFVIKNHCWVLQCLSAALHCTVWKLMWVYVISLVCWVHVFLSMSDQQCSSELNYINDMLDCWCPLLWT